MAKRSSGTPATLALDRAKIAYRTHPYAHDDAVGGHRHGSYGAEAAQALGVDPARMFKTLLTELPGGELVTAVVPVAGQLDLKALAAAVGAKKAAMADPAVAERTTGMVVGGISPIGQRQRHRSVVDTSAADFETIFCSAGKRGLQLELAPADLLRVTGGEYAPIVRR
ncbi:Cys-tRNA(Pro) deacylase [Enemella evansiae]|uniref:Cys-tRNA(Pro) deacylase n=1 Tax=Enemella evansiae TaxID=2016499 RepID=UPI000B975039|nr:Cys-tRNA(Pro) deacylase [Enemella evansiae]OYO07351.1 Cys-tRNA(Pro) deacylase [Enemella evansiae]